MVVPEPSCSLYESTRTLFCCRPKKSTDAEQIFGEGFSTPVLRRVAELMEGREHLEASAVRRKGAPADKVRGMLKFLRDLL